MKLLITGICGFVGQAVARGLAEALPRVQIVGLDNLARPGSETNRRALRPLGIRVLHGDIRCPSDLEPLAPVDWIIDAAANPSVLAGVDGKTSSRQLIEHNLLGTLNLLECCKRWSCGFLMLSTSRVYSIAALAGLPMTVRQQAFTPTLAGRKIPGLTRRGIAESFSTQPPLSYYGASKLASELLALEYADALGVPVFINRCGVLAGAGQFGKADQGIFSFWIHSWRARRPLQYIGFDGAGHQVRDCLHPRDLTVLIARQLRHPKTDAPRVLNVGGGTANSLSLAQLSAWCADRFGAQTVGAQPANRPFDIPWVVLDATRCRQAWDWTPRLSMDAILEEIATHAEQHPQWLDLAVDG